VQIVTKQGRDVIAIDHIGSAHDELKLKLLLSIANERLNPGQMSLLDNDPSSPPAITMHGSRSRYLYQVLADIYTVLGFDVVDDPIFRDLVICRIIEPASKLDTIRILEGLGLEAPSYSTLWRSLSRSQEYNYRDTLAKCCFAATLPERLTLVLYDVTTLYFDAEKEDEFRIPGLSKERKLDPQITVGLLTDMTGFPLEVAAFEGNRAEVHTIIPVLDKFRRRHGLVDIVVVADAAMLSSANLETLEEMGYHYIVASRLAKCPHEVEEIAAGGELKDGQIIEGSYSVTVNHTRATRRVVYQYKTKRARLDLRNIEKVAEKAKRMVAGSAPIKRNRFLTIKGADKQVNFDLIESAKARAGIKGYVTDLADKDAQFIIDAYHRLFQIERSFRMSKTDLRARPIFHRTRDSIEAHLTIVFAALAMSRYIQERTGLSIKRFVQKLRPIVDGIICVDGEYHDIPAAIPAGVDEVVSKLQ
jgi:hypothetical protein